MEQNEKQTGLIEVDLGEKVIGEIELPRLDVTPYIGLKTKIERVKEFKGEFGYFIRIETETLLELNDGTEIRSSRLFGLQEDASGNLGWGKDTNLGVFLSKKGVKHYRELIGKEVIVQSITNKRDKRDYLSFN